VSPFFDRMAFGKPSWETTDDEGHLRSSRMRRSPTLRRRPPGSELSESTFSLKSRQTTEPVQLMSTEGNTRRRRAFNKTISAILRLLRHLPLRSILLFVTFALLVQPLERHTFTAAHVNEPLVLLSREPPPPPPLPAPLRSTPPSSFPPDFLADTQRHGLLGEQTATGITVLGFATVVLFIFRSRIAKTGRRDSNATEEGASTSAAAVEDVDLSARIRQERPLQTSDRPTATAIKTEELAEQDETVTLDSPPLPARTGERGSDRRRVAREAHRSGSDLKIEETVVNDGKVFNVVLMG
jgi:hypothetical protein